MLKDNNLLNEIEFLEVLSDEELEQVSGGGRFDDIIFAGLCRLHENDANSADQIYYSLLRRGFIESRGALYC